MLVVVLLVLFVDRCFLLLAVFLVVDLLVVCLAATLLWKG